jgi:hypothetical protein
MPRDPGAKPTQTRVGAVESSQVCFAAPSKR